MLKIFSERTTISKLFFFLLLLTSFSINLNKHVPKSKHEFQVYTELICARFEGLSESPFYEEFVKDVTRSLIKPLNLEKTRNVEQVLKVQINEQVKTGKKTKNKSKKQLNTGGGKGNYHYSRKTADFFSG